MARAEPNPYNRGYDMTKEADSVRTHLKSTSGKELTNNLNSPGLLGVSTNPVNVVSYDIEYMAIGGHIDNSLQEKIINFEYVDFLG